MDKETKEYVIFMISQEKVIHDDPVKSQPFTNWHN